MGTRLRRLLLLSFTVCGLGLRAHGQQGIPAYYEVSNFRRFKVTHTTEVRLPAGVEILRVYHGIPEPAGWAGLGYRAENLDLTPFGWAVQDEGKGRVWRWDLESPTFSQQTFVSRFDIASADRRLRTEAVKPAWKEVAPTPPAESVVPPNIRQVSLATRRDTPLESMVTLSRWMHDNQAYDGHAFETYPATDVNQTLARGRGACGHHAYLYAAVLKAWGIPHRMVFGVRMARTSEMWTPKYDWNRHVWVEVRLPGIGWVEVEPRTLKDPFFHPAELVRTSGVQSANAWVRLDGKWTTLDTFEDRTLAR